ncbi:MAG: hypothetical protein ACRC30_11200 [Clostridium sp.]
MVGKIILGAVEFVPDIQAPGGIGNILDVETPRLVDFGVWLADGIKSAILNLCEWLVTGVIDISYWGCMFVGLTALFLYIAGMKKAGKYVPISLMIYFLLQILKVGIQSVQ